MDDKSNVEFDRLMQAVKDENAELLWRLRELALKAETLASDALRCAKKAREYLEYTEQLLKDRES